MSKKRLLQDEEGSTDKQKLNLTDKAEWQYSDREKENLEVFYTRTARGNRIACMFVKCAPNARFTILHSHGNAVDLGQMSSFYLGLGSRINCNIFSYDYSGYGVSGGRPSEKNLYADIEAAWHAMRTKLGISPENIILYGQSIGTVPTVDLASRYDSHSAPNWTRSIPRVLAANTVLSSGEILSSCCRACTK